MRIGMARRAFRKGQACVFHIRFCIREENMALRARCFYVRPGKRIFCLSMAEERRGLPCFYGVTARAILAELATVLILVAAYAFLSKSKIGLLELFHEDAAARSGRNIFWFMTLLASYSSMFPRQSEARLAVVHGLAAWFPMNELKIGAVVLRMAARTILAGFIRVHPRGVHTAPLRYAFAYLRVTFKTFQLRNATA
jgi:hypothetical protein